MDNNELFRIGDVAKMFHLSVGSLRHYEKKGLLQPEYIDCETGYRYYSTRQFECLNTIRYLRMLDMSLKQIANFLKNRDIDRIQEMLWQQKEAVVRKQNELKVIEKKIEHRLKQIQDALSSELDSIRITQVGPRRISWIRNTLSIKSYLDLETSIRQLEQYQKDAVVFLGKVGVGIAKERLLEAQYDQYDMVFLLLDQEDTYEGTVEELPEETCVTLRFCGSHNEAAAQYKKLANFISDHKLRITGFSKEITMIDYGITDDTGKFVTEIQIPIQPI
ncbi:MerR family transcriptional regulator [Halocella sp. SP3-1]|uniref:MerR family transcriptional regulator n=1 Tax=Halocella sp. SP3-1 TaxID=2382161 RepID=UPI00197AAE27|nr:MerR family transcriptional regulator [Halocella sp. SP3-1]